MVNGLPILVVRHCSKLFYAISGKLTNQTSKNSEKPNFGPHFGPFGPDLPLLPTFFNRFYLC